jgi:uncharacterized protein HemX
MEILTTVISGLLTILVSVGAGYVYEWIQEKRRKDEEATQISYREKMAALTGSLADASKEVDRILNEMSEVARQREAAISDLETQLGTMTEREKQLQEKISTLEKVPLPAVEYFVQELEKGDKRSAWRDYMLFGLGVVVSTVVAIILKLVFGI